MPPRNQAGKMLYMNMRPMPLLMSGILFPLGAAVLLAGCVADRTAADAAPMARMASAAQAPNTLSKADVAAGWRLLWDGKTTAGWRGAKLDRFPERGWEIRDGVLSVLPSGGAESRNGGDIVTIEEFTEFELSLEFRITPGANSGIKYFVDTGLQRGEGSAIGLEFQILDDERHPDAKLGRDGNRTIGSLYDLIPARNLANPAQGKAVNPPGEWNHARIVVRGANVEHWLNGVKVVAFQRGSQPFRELVSLSKYKSWPAFGERPKGPILLQDHGDLVSFRSIKLRNLAGAR
ncbi:MAG: hypothetical protein B7Y36_16320 [Novosphingobium sp. 28-62-57]|nr:MAG: hypothetical protein B7Z36_00325 [Novosphingobium sp. 12-63-9]OYZ08567.1 MAG: hypothetical protein B7Y36_16320 [Novosphingobium sp. 28-62-57]